MNKNKIIFWKAGFGLILLILGIIFNYIIEPSEGVPFGAVGNFLLFTGIVVFLYILLRLLIKKPQRVQDERLVFISNWSTRISFAIMVLLGFIIMIYDMISPISVRIYLFVSYTICLFLLIHIIIYKVLEKKY